MELEVEIVERAAWPTASSYTEGFLTNNGVDTKHEIAVAARLTLNGPLQDFLIAPTLVSGQGARFSFQALGGQVNQYVFYWRDDAGRVRYNTGLVTAPQGRFFSSIGGWWETEPGVPRSQTWLPLSSLA